jgi:hypothetical protein
MDDPVMANPVLTWLRSHDLPVTREYYIAVATMGQEDYDWDEEDEMGMPEDLRDFDALARDRAARV